MTLLNSVQIRWSVVFAFCVPFLVTGCGSGLNEVTGTVKLDGKPAKGLEVRFELKDPSAGTVAIGYTQEDGTYKLHYPGDKTGAPAGDYTVSISGGEGADTARPVKVAAKYNSKTELTATVVSGLNKLDFDVTSEPSSAGRTRSGMGD